MDHFERELSRMMRDTQEHTPFESKHQVRLRSGVRARHRIRLAQRAVGSVLAVGVLGLGFLLLPHDRVEDRPQAPLPRPALSPASPSATPSPTSDVSPSGSATSTPTGTDEETMSASNTPTATGSSDTVTSDSTPTATATDTPPPSDTGTPSAPVTPANTPTTMQPSALVASGTSETSG